MNINFNKIFLYIFPFIYIIVFIYFITTIMFFLLPRSGITFIENKNTNLPYQKYSYYLKTNTIGQNNINTKNIQTLDRYELKAIVSTSSNKGWIIIEEKSGNKENLTLFYSDEVNGYLLEKIFKDHVIFIKNGKEYILKLDMENNNSYTVSNYKQTSQNSEIIEKNNGATISKKHLNNYVNNIEKIWNDISIKENFSGNDIDGFKIEKIVANSDFSKLGLKEGDIIKGVNNNKLNSYSEVLKTFGDINNIKYINIEILRNNEVMELNYEIN
ncbi:hypothetical protein CRU92_04035 [Arcobacter sp. FW59]|nr:hypothetical protein CRU92_04035 [Arcobacter sp. FW59]